jgi:hypothetical protein
MRYYNTLSWLVACKALVVSPAIVNSFPFPAVGVAARPNFFRTVAIFSSQQFDIEPYVGPVGNFADMEGGIAVENLHLNVLAGPSLVAQGRGLFLCIYNEMDLKATDEEEEVDTVEEVIIPQGTPLCGYSRGYFSDAEKGDKSVVFRFKEQSFHDTAVFYNQQLMTIVDAIWYANEERYKGGDSKLKEDEILFGHIVHIDHGERKMIIRADEKFYSRIFIPESLNDDDSQFSAAYLGVYANDLAYDPDCSKEEYLENSEKNNILQLVWRLAKDERSGMLVPTWPVIVAKKDIRLLNTVPMEVGLEYGFQYWDAYAKHGNSS